MEEWREVPNTSGVISVSSLGRVWDNRKDCQIKVYVNPRNGYVEFQKSINGKKRHFKVHRLVAQAFIPNPNNLSDVNHIDENKTNNQVSNLEWMSHYDNMHYGSCLSRISKSLKGRRQTEDNKQKISASLKRYYETHGANIMSDASRVKLSETRKGGNNPFAKAVLVWNENESYRFDSIVEATRALNVPHRGVFSYIDTAEMYKGYYWKRDK